MSPPGWRKLFGTRSAKSGSTQMWEEWHRLNSPLLLFFVSFTDHHHRVSLPSLQPGSTVVSRNSKLMGTCYTSLPVYSGFVLIIIDEGQKLVAETRPVETCIWVIWECWWDVRFVTMEIICLLLRIQVFTVQRMGFGVSITPPFGPKFGPSRLRFRTRGRWVDTT